MKPFLVSGFVTGAKQNSSPLGVERKECSERIAFALDTYCCGMNCSQYLRMAWVT